MVRHRKFEGYTGMAVKNSIYQFSTTLISKIGSLFFTILLARFLLSDLFGMYSLALSIILLFVSFSELGVSSTLIRFISSSLSKNKPRKAKAYFLYLSKIRGIIILLSCVGIIIFSKVLANFFHKPLFFVFIIGAIYILFLGLAYFLESAFQAVNNFKIILVKEIFFQVLRVGIIVPSILFLSGKTNLNIVVLIFLMLSVAYAMAFLFLYLKSKKYLTFLKKSEDLLSVKEKAEVRKFIAAIFITACSGILFGYADMFLLGRFVESQFIGYYSAAAGLIGSLSPLIVFSIVLFPIFSRLEGGRLERGFRIGFRITLALSLFFLLLIFFAAPFVVSITFGKEYLAAVPILKLLSLLMIPVPLISLYTSYLLSVGHPEKVTKALIIAGIFNTLLIYLFVSFFIKFSPIDAVLGVSAAVVISRFLYLAILIFIKKRTS